MFFLSQSLLHIAFDHAATLADLTTIRLLPSERYSLMSSRISVALIADTTAQRDLLMCAHFS